MKVFNLILSVAILGLSIRPSLAAQDKLVDVTGTKVRMTPPTEFKPSERFPGFGQEETQASILVTEMPAPYSKLVEAFTPEGLATRGMKLLSRREVSLGGRPALLFEIRQVAESTPFLKWMAMTGTEKETAIITATFPESMKTRYSAALEASVLSAVWNADAKTDPLEGLNFSVGEFSGLKLARRVGNMILLTKDGELPGKPTNDPLLVIGSSFSEVKVADLKSFADKRLRQITQITDPVVETQRSLTIAGLEGSEIIAKATWKDRPQDAVAVFQIVLLDQKNYFIIQGFAAEAERKNYLELFSKIAQSFQKK